ncbi:hypothetical protein [Roseomonas harenae]|uniref:hypothetical protein n=1 Tax=Muricoccus harenae TaxID=2692566 RepID=UPI0013312612|nr:hypothetical protein [Roseomonas harenae]
MDEKVALPSLGVLEPQSKGLLLTSCVPDFACPQTRNTGDAGVQAQASITSSPDDEESVTWMVRA